MEKEIEVILKSKDSIFKTKVNAIFNREKKEIYYVEQDDSNTVVIFDYENNILKRDNLELYMVYDFNNSDKSKLLIKALNKELKPIINTTEITKTKKSIIVKYMMENEVYSYIIKM